MAKKIILNPKRKITTTWQRNHSFWRIYFKFTYFKEVLFKHPKLSITAVVGKHRKSEDKRWYYFVRYQNVPRYEDYTGYCLSRKSAMARVDAFLEKKRFRESKKTLAELEILK